MLVYFFSNVYRQGMYNLGLDVTIRENGFLVKEAAPDSIAGNAGIKKGDYIIKINQIPVSEIYKVSVESEEAFLRISSSLFPPGGEVHIVDEENNRYALSIPRVAGPGNPEAINKTFLTNFIIGIFLIVMGAYFFLRGTASFHVTLFYLFSVFAGGAAAFSFFHSYWASKLLLFRFIALDTFGYGAGTCLVLFALAFPRRRITGVFPLIAGLGLPFLIKYILIFFFGFTHFGFLSFLIHAFIFISITTAITVIIRQYRRSATGDKRRIRWFFSGAIISVIPYLLYLGFLLILQQYIRGNLFAVLNLIANSALLLFPLLIGIGIVHHSLFDVDWLLKQLFSVIVLGLLYTALTVLVTSLYNQGPRIGVFTVVIASAAVLGPFIYKKTQIAADKIFYKRKQRTQDAYHLLGQELILCHSTYQVYQTVGRTLGSVYLPEFVGFFRNDEESDIKTDYKWTHPACSQTNPTAELIKDAISEDTIAELPNGGILIPIPLGTDGKLCLGLGKRLDKDLFLKEDVNLLTTLAFQIAQALTNAGLYEELQLRLDEKDHLLQEVHHRVKNNMQLMSSLLHLQAGNSREPEVLKILSESRNRIDSMALIHETLYQSENFAEVDMGDYCKSIVSSLQNVYIGAEQNVFVEVNIDNVYLNVDSAIPCGLIVNELVSNAFKYAFPDKKTGRIGIEMKNRNGQLTLCVSDNGVSIEDDTDIFNPKTLGLTLITILTQQLHGSFHFNQKEDGKAFIINFRTAPAK